MATRGFARSRPSELLNSRETRFAAFYCEPGIAGAHEKGGVEGQVGYFRRNYLVPVPEVDSLAELNARIAAAGQAEDARRIGARIRTIGQDFAAEAPRLVPLPDEPFETGLLLTPRVDRYSQVTVRMNRYSVPVRLIGRQVRVVLRSSELVIYDGRHEAARHERMTAKGGETLVLDHYLEALMRKPGALAGSVPLDQARAAGAFTGAHEALWSAARRADGEPAATRVLVEVLLLHRHMDAADVITGIEAALSVGAHAAERRRGRGPPGRRRPRRRTRPPGRRRRAGGSAAGHQPDTAPPRRAARRHPAAARRQRLRPAAHAAPHQPGRPVMTRARGITEEAAEAAVDTACRVLRLPTIRGQFTGAADKAEREQLTYRGFLAELLMAECEDRDRRRAERQVRGAGFPRAKWLADFDFNANPGISPAVINTLAACNWVRQGSPLCLIGDSGTGKSHLLIALGTAAAMAGFRVRYTLASKLANELAEAADDRQLTKTIARYGRADLLCIDELGYMELDRRGAELLFQVLTEREETASVAIASNESFSGWTKTFTDPRLCAAIVDRLTFNATIIETGTESYRLARARAGTARPAA